VNMISLQDRLGVGRARLERRRDGNPADKLFSASKDLLISARAKSLLETAKLPDDMKFIPTDVIAPTGAEVGIDGNGFQGSGIVRHCYPHQGGFHLGIELLSPGA